MEINSGVYKISFTNDKNKKVYIGISNNLKRRKTDHLYSLNAGNHKNDYLQNAFKYYGKENFNYEILERCEVIELVEKEVFYILKFNSFKKGFGYNLTSGGEHKILAESTKKKLSIVKKGRRLSKETKLKLTIHNLLKNRPNIRINVVDEVLYVNDKIYSRGATNKIFKTPEQDLEYIEKRKIISKATSDRIKKIATGRIKSIEEINKLKKANIGRKSSDETKVKIGSYHIGKDITDYHKNCIAEKLGHKIMVTFCDGTNKIFKSKSEFKLKIGIQIYNISNKMLALKGISKIEGI